MLTRLARQMRRIAEFSADDFELTIFVEETTLPQGENFEFVAELRNNTDYDFEITASWLFTPHIPNWSPFPPDEDILDHPGFLTKMFRSGEIIRSDSPGFGFFLRFGRDLETGQHTLRVSASFTINAQDGVRRIAVRSNTITLTVQ